MEVIRMRSEDEIAKEEKAKERFVEETNQRLADLKFDCSFN